MKRDELVIKTSRPILPGSVFISHIKCGKKNCQCYANPKLKHTIYQWSGIIEGKNTTRTLNKEMYLECKKRIGKYKKIKDVFNQECQDALKNAPWIEKHQKNAKNKA